MWIYNHNLLVPKQADAITLYPFVFTRLSKEQVSDRLRRHEEEHLKQAREAWVIGFYVMYFVYYLKNRAMGQPHYQAYLNIPYEIEARKAENPNCIDEV